MHSISRRCSVVSPGFRHVGRFIPSFRPRKACIFVVEAYLNTTRWSFVDVCAAGEGERLGVCAACADKDEEAVGRHQGVMADGKVPTSFTSSIIMPSLPDLQMPLFRFRVDPESTGPQFNVISLRQTKLPALCCNLVAFSRQYIITLARKVTKQAGRRHTE